MKKFLLILFITTIWSCSSDNANNAATLEATQQLDVAYGSDAQQTYDIYLPAGRTNATKVMFIVHGGSWISGSKEDMNPLVLLLKTQYPQYAIVNLNYRLATTTSPAYPKQTDDIASVMEHVESNYSLSQNYGMIGTSAGGHLSMLYAYKLDTQNHVKVVCNIVGPSDFNDPSYAGSELETTLLPYLAGSNITDEYLTVVSPITHVSATSPPTIQFMGNADPLIPVTQGQRLKTRLDSFDISNELHTYNAGHGDFSFTDTQEIYSKMGNFLSIHF